MVKELAIYVLGKRTQHNGIYAANAESVGIYIKNVEMKYKQIYEELFGEMLQCMNKSQIKSISAYLHEKDHHYINFDFQSANDFVKHNQRLEIFVVTNCNENAIKARYLLSSSILRKKLKWPSQIFMTSPSLTIKYMYSEVPDMVAVIDGMLGEIALNHKGSKMVKIAGTFHIDSALKAAHTLTSRMFTFVYTFLSNLNIHQIFLI